VRTLGAQTTLPGDADILGPVLEGLTDGVAVFDAENQLKAVNSSYLGLFGLGRDELVRGMPLRAVLEVLGARGGLPADLEPEEAIRRRLAMWGTRADRRERRFLASGRVHDIMRSRTDNGDVIAVHVDVTEALERERALEMQRIYMDSILRNITDGVALIDAHGFYIAFNERFLELYRIDPMKVCWGIHVRELGRHFGDLDGLPEETRAREAAERMDFALDPARRRVRRELRDGRVLDVTKSLLPAGGSVLTIRDITDDLERERELEEARRRAEESSLHKSRFLARMSHEMRTPLNGVLGTAALLGRTELDARQRDYVGVIAGSGDMLLRLVDDVLDLSRIETGSIELVRRPLGLCTVMREAVGLIEPSATAKGLAIEKDPSPAPVPPMLGDPVRIKQVLLNLLSNAVKFTDAGTITVGLRVSEPAPGLCRCRMRVADTGIGIPPGEQEAVFGQFHQIDASSTRRTGGAGLGLTLTRKLIDAMEGRIELVSAPGEGSEFTVELDLPRAD
jgi:signal transduction histidine kinase